MPALLGPIQMFLIGLENDKMRGQVAQEIMRASDQGVIRVIDALAIQRTSDGEVISLGASDLTPDQRMEYGALVGGLLGLGATGTEEGLEEGAEMGAETFADQNFGMSADDIQDIAADLPPDTTALMILIEHVWAIRLKDALASAGGIVLAQGMVRPEDLIALGAVMSTPPLADPSMGQSQDQQSQPYQ